MYHVNIMEYSQNYPCLYGATGYGSNIIKLGTSFHIANRKSGYKTQWLHCAKFEFVIVLRKDSISPQELYKLDAKFLAYLQSNDYGNYHFNEGGGTELYSMACPVPYVDLMKGFLEKEGLPTEAIILDDPFPIRDLNSTENEELRSESRTKLKIIANSNLRDKFFQIFLPDKVPHRIQSELWDCFKKVCDDGPLRQSIYKGIVQWPTGTGKTIAILLMIVLAKEECDRLEIIYRGLLISPKNDIFNTITSKFKKLSKFGITICDGSNGKLSSIPIPTDKHILVMACPQSLIKDDTGMKNLPAITHVHYDEVHRITGEICFQLLKEMLVKWDTKFLTGTSATPKTSSKEQHQKLAEIFGDPYPIIHKCDVDEAVREKWIATPRFSVCTTPKQEKENRGAYVKSFVLGLKNSIQKKKEMGLWRGGKVIAYLPSIQEVKNAAEEAQNIIPDATIYLAIGSDGERTDTKFVTDSADGSLRILFACERYREGSDIEGLDMTAILIGNSISAYILIQIQGRALRKDHEGKEGWCVIVSPCEEGETEQDVLDRIALDILTFIGDSRPLVKKDFEKYVETYFGDVVVGGQVITKDETVARVQAAYVRREYNSGRFCFNKIRQICLENLITSIAQYNEFRVNNGLPETPWKDKMMTAYDFFHPDSDHRMNVDIFKNILLTNNVRTTDRYVEWRVEQPESYPSVEEVIEGYFHNIVNFQDLLPEGRRRR